MLFKYLFSFESQFITKSAFFLSICSNFCPKQLISVISFCKKKLTPQKQGAINIYTAKTYSEELPFMSILFENTGNYDASVDFNIKERGTREFS